eukprot:3742624-Amphidinium_carterae.1
MTGGTTSVAGGTTSMLAGMPSRLELASASLPWCKGLGEWRPVARGERAGLPHFTWTTCPLHLTI